MKQNIFFFDSINKSISDLCGNKAYIEALLYQEGFNVPYGFCIIRNVFDDLLESNGISSIIELLLQDMCIDSLGEISTKIKKLIFAASFSEEFIKELDKSYCELKKKIKSNNLQLAIRSSATYEDSSNYSCAGQHDSYLNICTFEEMINSIKNVFASLYNERALIYRIHNNISEKSIGIACLIQEMIISEKMVSGVLFTVDPTTGFEAYVIQSVWGIGEGLVQGITNADEFMVDKNGLHNKYEAIIKKKVGIKNQYVIYDTIGTLVVPVEKEYIKSFSLKNNQIIELAIIASKLEIFWKSAFKKEIFLDCEWVYNNYTKKFYIVQVRPETVLNAIKNVFSLSHTIYSIDEKNIKPFASGYRCGTGVIYSFCFVAHSLKEAISMPEGAILVTSHTTPDWVKIMKKASGIITETGSTTCHAAIVARELGIPAILGVENFMSNVINGSFITMDCTNGAYGIIYNEKINYKKEEKLIGKNKTIDSKLYAIVADPNKAFELHKLPFEGVGLLRLEFLLTHVIGIHPLALLNFTTLSLKDKNIILDLIYPYLDPLIFFIEELARGIASIAYSFYNKPVIVRMSDFKTNEYNNLILGSIYEPKEENPMLGLRGASRYINPIYKKAFELECKAICYARDIIGATNIDVMIPFVRTIEEIKIVKKLLIENGVLNKKFPTKLYMMVEIPSNVFLLEDYAEYVDGFSIGSNDLMQLTLGVDRDSSLHDKYSVLDEAVIFLIDMAIEKAKKMNKPIGICGQAPAENKSFADYLNKKKITSIAVDKEGIFNFFE